jgi:hypothetical protein
LLTISPEGKHVPAVVAVVVDKHRQLGRKVSLALCLALQKQL